MNFWIAKENEAENLGEFDLNLILNSVCAIV